MNLKPAPFELLGHLIAATLGDRPADMKGMVHVHLHRSPLADRIGHALSPADVPATLRADCVPAPFNPFPRPTAMVGHEPPRVALLEAAVSAPVENPNLDRPGIDQNARACASPHIKAVGAQGKQYRLIVKDEFASLSTARREKIALPPLKDPRSTIVVRPTKPLPRLMSDIRREQLTGAIAFLKRQGILVSVYDREAQLRRYRVTGKAYSKSHEEVIEIAVARGFEVPA